MKNRIFSEISSLTSKTISLLIHYTLQHTLHTQISALILMSNLQMYDSLLHKQDSAKNVRYPRASNIFIYFSSLIDTKIGYLKLRVGLFNS